MASLDAVDTRIGHDFAAEPSEVARAEEARRAEDSARSAKTAAQDELDNAPKRKNRTSRRPVEGEEIIISYLAAMSQKRIPWNPADPRMWTPAAEAPGRLAGNNIISANAFRRLRIKITAWAEKVLAAPPPFLRLPTEIRVSIYEFILQPINAQTESNVIDLLGTHPNGLRLVNRIVHSETMELYNAYWSDHFKIQRAKDRFLHSRGETITTLATTSSVAFDKLKYLTMSFAFGRRLDSDESENFSVGTVRRVDDHDCWHASVDGRNFTVVIGRGLNGHVKTMIAKGYSKTDAARKVVEMRRKHKLKHGRVSMRQQILKLWNDL
ncbi:unnamed protein product [Zymoseptoria tritici ST99CH_1A5]|uniref:Uncharacterized protein n=1 Tax=Zymoseptoria tritici ST99CH_1A5 TaxID=1276529 RepID=A0A1Y6LPW6_ZYMTR|nr:unnamed protein product [Zymoseptoria tritici ST99CH_1A5]